jgi:hypothetical protein
MIFGRFTFWNGREEGAILEERIAKPATGRFRYFLLFARF